MNNLKFIDIHTHGAFGVDFNNATYEQIKFLLRKLFEKNIKAICPTLVGDNPLKLQKQLEIFKKIKQEQLKNKDKEAFLIGAHLEGTFLSPEKSGIQDKTNFLKPTIENFKLITKDYSDIVKIVTIAPEEDIDLIDYLLNKNIVPQAGHCVGGEMKNCLGVTHIFNAMPQIHHRINSVALKALVDDKKYCELIADLKHCSLSIIKLVLKAKPIDKILLISDSLPVSNFDNEIVFCNKKINTQGRDDFGNLAGSILTLDEICLNLLKNNILSESEILKMAFYNQIQYLKLDNTEIDVLNS